MTQWIKWNEMPWEEVNENISRKMVMGDRVMMIMYRFRNRAVWQEEKHDAEQGGYIIKGRALLRIPDDDKELVLGPGDGYLIESDRRHSWRYVDDEVIFIDFFSPPRFELLEQKLAPKAAMASPEE
jgi:quercetin dioxygenase-like cupin family protein